MTPQELFEVFPEAKTAQESKTSWAYEPETAEYGQTFFTYEEESNSWYTTVYCAGFEYDVETDQFLAVTWEYCDGWSTVDGCPIEHYERLAEESRREAGESYREYLEWVAENGQDPCEEFFIRQNPTERQQWEITFKRRDDKTIITNWKQLTGAPVEENAFPPEGVFEYMDFCVKTRTLADGTIQSYPSTHLTWEKIIDAAKNTSRDNDEWSQTMTVRDWTFAVKAELWVTYCNDDYVNQLKAAACKALEGIQP